MNSITLVTGATGFIGSHLVDALLSAGRRVRCLVTNDSDVARLKKLDVELIYGDLLDRGSLQKAVENVAIVHHLAAKVQPSKIIERNQGDVDEFHRINYEGTINLVQACAKQNLDKFIYYSSVAAVGPGKNITEESDPHPLTLYGKSKYEAEKFLKQEYLANRFPVVVLRPGKIYGPRDKALLSVVRFLKRGYVPQIGGGKNITPICYIDDLINAILLAEERCVNGEEYFITSESVAIRSFIESFMRSLGRECPMFSLSSRIMQIFSSMLGFFERIFSVQIYPCLMDLHKGNVFSMTTDWSCHSEKIRKHVGFEPVVGLQEGMQKTADWYKKNNFV